MAPREWLQAALEAKSTRMLQAGGLSQALVEGLLSSPRYDERLAALRGHYKSRAALLLAKLPMLHSVHFTMPSGGFSVCVETELRGSDETFLRHALKRGVAFDPGCLFRPRPGADQQCPSKKSPHSAA